MSYFIFTKDADNIEGTICKIAENQFDLDNLNIDKNSHKIIEDSQSNFDLVKYSRKSVLKYNNNIITYSGELEVNYTAKQFLKDYIESVTSKIKKFTDINKNHVLFSRWDNYFNQLNNLNLDNIEFPLNKSLEQYLKDQNLTSLNPLQIP
jgi:hypothetical protein